MYQAKVTQYPAKVEPLFTGPDQTLMSTWFRETSIPRFDKKRHQFQYPFVFEPSWSQVVADIESALAAARMGWIPNYPNFIFDLARLQWTYPFLSLYLGPITEFAVVPIILAAIEMKVKATSLELKVKSSGIELKPKLSTTKI